MCWGARRCLEPAGTGMRWGIRRCSKPEGTGMCWSVLGFAGGSSSAQSLRAMGCAGGCRGVEHPWDVLENPEVCGTAGMCLGVLGCAGGCRDVWHPWNVQRMEAMGASESSAGNIWVLQGHGCAGGQQALSCVSSLLRPGVPSGVGKQEQGQMCGTVRGCGSPRDAMCGIWADSPLFWRDGSSRLLWVCLAAGWL